MKGKKIAWIVVAAVAGFIIVVLLLLRAERSRVIAEALNIPIEGAVIRRDVDSKRELPIADVEITASDGVKSATAKSDAAGYYKLVFRKGVLSDRPILVTFHHPGYQAKALIIQTGRLAVPKQLYVAALVPNSPPAPAKAEVRNSRPASVVSNIRVRYTMNARSERNVGSAVKTFQVVNEGNVPCNQQGPCSPDGKWKAASGSVTLDAGADNSFTNVRASCIAGPCPFTRIDTSGFAHGGRTITVSALNWSDTATFLVEAEAYHTAIGAEVRELYPVIYGQALNFTVPPSQEGVSLEADLNGSPMVFPLGPNLSLSWAACNVRSGTEEEKTMVYRCELKPGYRFG